MWFNIFGSKKNKNESPNSSSGQNSVISTSNATTGMISDNSHSHSHIISTSGSGGSYPITSVGFGGNGGAGVFYGGGGGGGGGWQSYNFGGTMKKDLYCEDY